MNIWYRGITPFGPLVCKVEQTVSTLSQLQPASAVGQKALLHGMVFIKKARCVENVIQFHVARSNYLLVWSTHFTAMLSDWVIDKGSQPSIASSDVVQNTGWQIRPVFAKVRFWVCRSLWLLSCVFENSLGFLKKCEWLNQLATRRGPTSPSSLAWAT